MRALLVSLALLAVPAGAPASAAPTPKPGLQSGPDATILDGSAQAALADARAAWSARGLRDYDFRLQVGCFCPEDITAPRTIRVRHGKALNANRYNRAFATVPKLFRRIQNAIDSEAATLRVTYSARGLPRRIYIDQDERIADEELSLSASRLREA